MVEVPVEKPSIEDTNNTTTEETTEPETELKEIEVSDSIKMLDGSYISYDDYNERLENDDNKKLENIFGKDTNEEIQDLPF